MDGAVPMRLYSNFLHYWLLVGSGKEEFIIFNCIPSNEPRFNGWFKTHGYRESPGKFSASEDKTKRPEHKKGSCKQAGRLTVVGGR